MDRNRSPRRLVDIGGLAAVCVALAFAVMPAFGQPPEKKPNIIVILADDLGYGDLGCYGQEQIKTPRIDRMAREGMRFTAAYAGSTVCAPSRCSLMTGKHQGHAHVRGNRRVPLPAEEVTVAEFFKESGYTTGLVGKWGLGEPDTTGIPNRQGFDSFYGYLNQGRAHNYYPEYLWRNQEKAMLDNVVDQPQVATKRVDYSHDLFTEEAVKFIREQQGNPFFLYLAYTIPHANNERGRALGNGMEVPDYGLYADQDWPAPQKGHAAMITRMDNHVGLILDLLQELELARNTLVIFTSDNGPHKEGGADPEFFDSNGPLRGIKRDLYEGGIRVPGIAWWPGIIEPGSTSDLPWGFWDFFATTADLLEREPPEDIDGVSILPTLLGNPDEQEVREVLYWEFHGGGFKQAVRMGDWKAVRPDIEAKVELYYLPEDIGERNSVADERPELVARAKKHFDAMHTPSKYWLTPAEVKAKHAN